jgi:hypothetical protein
MIGPLEAVRGAVVHHLSREVPMKISRQFRMCAAAATLSLFAGVTLAEPPGPPNVKTAQPPGPPNVKTSQPPGPPQNTAKLRTAPAGTAVPETNKQPTGGDDGGGDGGLKATGAKLKTKLDKNKLAPPPPGNVDKSRLAPPPPGSAGHVPADPGH